MTTTDKDIAYITNLEDTTFSIDFQMGLFLKISVTTHFYDEGDNIIADFVESDDVQFFTEPLYPITNLLVEDQPGNKHELNWSPSKDDYTNLIIYRSFIEVENSNIPNLVVDASNGLPISNYENWEIIYQGTDIDSSYIDSISIFSEYKYFYSIKLEDDVENQDYNNYRYSLISPQIPEDTNQISSQHP